MSNFCHDEYDHPLLWCDGKRRLVERQNAAQAQALVRQHKDEERAQRIAEQREYRDMTMKHCPWGKPGAGAPGEQTRRGNILQLGLFPATGNDFRSYSSVQQLGSKLGRSAIGLQRLHSVQQTASGAIPEHRRLSKTNQQSSPWGRPGPGGQPWRNPATIGKAFMRSMGWTDAHTLQQIDPDRPDRQAVAAAGAGDQATGANRSPRSPRQKTKPAPFLPPMKCCCSKCCCNCGLIFRDEHELGTKSRNRVKQTHSQRIGCAVGRTEAGVGCGGGGGGGGGGGVELVPLLARRRAKQQSHALSTTDVTKLPNPSKFEETGHLNDLCRQIRQKKRREELEREVENVSCGRHFQTLDSLWGRPGHGAPRDIKNKLNLDTLLYKMPMQIVDKEL